MPATFSLARFAEAGLLDEPTRDVLADLPAAATVADLEAARDALVALAERLAAGDMTADVVNTLEQLADGCAAVDAETESRSRLAASAANVLNRIRPAIAEPADTALSPTERAAAMAARRPAANAPRRTTSGGAGTLRATITAGGQEIGDAGQLVEAMTAAMDSAATRQAGQRLHNLVASAKWQYPEDRQLTGDAERNARIIDRVTGPQALTASGGICSPVNIDYSIPTFSAMDRPVLAALPSFGADRGGVRYLTPPSLATVATAVGVWTSTNDANPTSPSTKARYTVACGSEVQVTVDAITLRLKVGNFVGRFSPEWVAAHMELSAATHARVAEQNLLNKIFAGSTETTVAKLLGSTSDLLGDVSLAAAALRYRLRQRSDAVVRVIVPAFTRDMLRADLARRLPGDSTLAVTDAQLDQYFAVRNVAVAWALDGVVAQGSGNTYPAQTFAAQSSGVLLDYPAKIVFACYPEGSWQFLDGGQLDLGIVRDSTLDSTNDFETFSESFENVAFRGIESLKVIAALRPNGTAAATVDTSAY